MHCEFRSITRTLEVAENDPLHYHEAEVLWKMVIMSHECFPAMNVSNVLAKALNRREKHEQTEFGTRKRTKRADGKRKRTTKDVGNNCHVESPIQTHPTITNVDTDATSAVSFLKQESFDVLLVSMHYLCDMLNSRGNNLDGDRCHPFVLDWPHKLDLCERSSMLAGMHDLARIFAAQGKDLEAEELIRITVNLMETELELDDPGLSNAMNSLAVILTKRGANEEAEAVYRETLKLRNKVLMWDDQKTQETLKHLCILLKKQGRYRQAAELVQAYRLPITIKSIIFAMHECTNFHVGLIDDHHDDMDIQVFVETDVPAVERVKLRSGDNSLAIELILDPEDLRIVLIISRRALMSTQQQLVLAIKHSLEYGIGDWQDLGIHTFVCSIDQDEHGMVWALPHHLDL